MKVLCNKVIRNIASNKKYVAKAYSVLRILSMFSKIDEGKGQKNIYLVSNQCI